MSNAPQRNVVVVDRDLATGLAVNAASIATSMIIHAVPELMGQAVKARDTELPGVILVPLPVLAADSATLADLWSRCRGDGSAVDPFPFTTLAQSCRTYLVPMESGVSVYKSVGVAALDVAAAKYLTDLGGNDC